MVIERLKIFKLYGQRNYDVQFDSQLTFLYGANGCGKTTVLNILTAIVTGKIYDLVDYNFESIELSYSDEKIKKSHIQDGKIQIKMYSKNKSRTIELSFDNKTHKIEDIDNLEELLYIFAKKISQKFNYIYLPLNRYVYDRFNFSDYSRYDYFRRIPYETEQNSYNSYLNESLNYVSELIRERCMSIYINENTENDKFRKEVLSATIQVSSDIPISQIIEEIEDFNWDDVLKSKEAYIKTLKEIDVYDKHLENKIENFFTAFKKAYDDYVSQQSDDKKKSRIRIGLAWQSAEFQKINKIAELAKKNEKTKEKIRQPKILFENLINNFFKNSATDKKIRITNEGQVIFELPDNNKLHFTNLSSGEKQILITFASLIFGLQRNNNNTGIFIVDEPEASLHLEWQNKFVSAILQTNKNIQLIFATHSPELIGKFSDKAFKLM